MRRVALWWMCAVGCPGGDGADGGDGQDTDGPDCVAVALDDCDATPGCALLEGKPLAHDPVDDGLCVDPALPDFAYGCHAADQECTEAETLAREVGTDECRWFRNGCIPAGWETCDDRLDALRTCNPG